MRLAKSIDEVKTFAEQMLGKTLVTIQTGPAGRVVKRVFVEDGATSRANSTSPRWSTAPPRASP